MGLWNAVSIQFRCACEHQTAALDSLESAQFGTHFLQCPGPSAKNNDFQAVVMVQMDVHRGDDLLVVVVLNVGQRSFNGCL